jgi:hypothetical protein
MQDRELIDRQFWLSSEEDSESLPDLLQEVRPEAAETLEFE